MFTRNSMLWLGLATGVAAWGQPAGRPDPASAIRLNLPRGAPVSIVSTDFGDSRVQPRGGALVLDLHATLTLRNNSPQSIRGVTLLVLAQEMTAGGKGSVAVPSLNVPPGQSFPVRINLRLLRPLPAPAGPLVEVDLDGVLFADFSFFGPNRLESRRTLTVWEMEARRDREYLKSVLKKEGAAGLQQEILASLGRQASRPRLDVQVSRGGARAISAAVNALTGRNVNFAFLQLPDSPLEALSGAAQVNGAEASSPRIEVMNRSDRPVRYFEMGWIVKDASGQQFLAGSVPASSPALDLRPGRSAVTLQERSYRFTRGSEQPPTITGMTGFVSQVEFADGRIWIPSRKDLSEGSLLGIVPVSAEEQRLSEIYRTKGLQALIEELGKF
jgi:hypothetical protein